MSDKPMSRRDTIALSVFHAVATNETIASNISDANAPGLKDYEKLVYYAVVTADALIKELDKQDG